MGNPYYIPPRKSNALNWADLGLKYKDMKLNEAEQGRRNRVTTAEYGKPGGGGGLAQERINTQRGNTAAINRRTALGEDKLNIETPEDDKNFGEKHVLGLESSFAAQDALLGDDPGKGDITKAFKPVSGFARLMAKDDNFSKGGAYALMRQSAEPLKRKVISNLSEAYKKAEKEGDVVKMHGLREMIGELDQAPAEALIDQAFPKTVMAIRMKAEQEGAQLDYRKTEEAFLAHEAGLDRRARLTADKPPRPTKPTETQRQIDLKLTSGLKKITHDKEGKGIDKPSSTQLDALAKSAAEYGKEVVSIKLPAKEIPGMFNDLKARNIYFVVDQGGTVTKEDIARSLVSDYNISEKDAKRYADAWASGK